MTLDAGFADLTGAKILVVENDRDYLAPVLHARGASPRRCHGGGRRPLRLGADPVEV